jgi:hypothetical protein
MSQATLDRAAAVDVVLRLGREAVGILAGGLIGSIAWMVVSHEALNRGWNDQDFSRALGEIRGAELTDVPRLGLWTGLFIGTLLAAVALPLLFRIIPGPWYVRSAPLALAAFVLWGLWFSPMAGEESRYPGGIFGADAGVDTFVTYLVTALAYGMVAGRIYSVAKSADFWRPKHNDLREQGAQIIGELEREEELTLRERGEASLELPEERSRESGEATRS